MIKFVDFILLKVYKSKSIPKNLIRNALKSTIKDIKYHFPKVVESEIEGRIESNSNELAIFLFRLGRELHENKLEKLKPQIHWLMKELCSCEIYFNNEIDEGFYIVHGTGTVIGSRNKIGKGFIIHQGCTIGHKKNGEGNGSLIGNDVTLYCNSSIIGDLIIGNNVVIGGHYLVFKNIKENAILLNNHKDNE